MSNLKDQIELDPYGDPKENAWFWLAKNSVLAYIAGIICTGCASAVDGDSVVMLFFCIVLAVGIPFGTTVYNILWYNDLVSQNLIKTFSNSKLFSKT